MAFCPCQHKPHNTVVMNMYEYDSEKILLPVELGNSVDVFFASFFNYLDAKNYQ